MNTYLIVSETNYFIEEKIKELNGDNKNIITFNMNESSIDEVLEEASYFSMFDDKKTIIVKNAFFFSSLKSDSNKSKECSDKLLKYLDNENKNTMLIFIVNKSDSKKKIFNILKDNNNVFIYNNLSKTEQKNKLKDIISKNKFNISDNSLWYIINNSLGNFDIEVIEINKLMLYYMEPTFIEDDVVVGLVSKSIEDNNYKIVDSIIKKDLNQSLKYLKDINILRIDPSIIIALLYREFKLMLSVLIYEDNKINRKDIMTNLKLAEWQYNKVIDNLRHYKTQEIKNEIIKLSDIDYKYKSGNIDKDIILINYIMDVCS